MLHLFCGKIASGKSTLARQIAEAEGGVLLSEDRWLHALYADQLKTGADYRRCNALLRSAMAPHLVDLLRAGLTVVLDFQANTLETRAWMRGVIEQSGADHRLHVLLPSDAVCLARLKARNAAGTHPFVVTDDQFHAFSKHVVAPHPDEGFTLVQYDR